MGVDGPDLEQESMAANSQRSWRRMEEVVLVVREARRGSSQTGF